MEGWNGLASCPTKVDHWLISWRLDTGDREDEDEFDLTISVIAMMNDVLIIIILKPMRS